jgi:hypothetical protein
MCNWNAAERYGDIIVREKNAPRRQRGVFCIVNQVCAEAGVERVLVLSRSFCHSIRWARGEFLRNFTIALAGLLLLLRMVNEVKVCAPTSSPLISASHLSLLWNANTTRKLLFK